jgi:hypothetical protein
MEKKKAFEVVCYGKNGAAIAIINTNDIEAAIDNLVPGTVKIIVHDGKTGKYIIEL